MERLLAPDRVAVSLEERLCNHFQHHPLEQNQTTAIRQTSDGKVKVVREAPNDLAQIPVEEDDRILALIHVDRGLCSVSFEALQPGWTVSPPQAETAKLESAVQRWHTIEIPSSVPDVDGNVGRSLVLLRPDDNMHFVTKNQENIDFRLLVRKVDVQVDSSIPVDGDAEAVTESKEVEQTQEQQQGSSEPQEQRGSAPRLQVAQSMQESAAAQSTMSKATPAPPSQFIEETPTARRMGFGSQGSTRSASGVRGTDGKSGNRESPSRRTSSTSRGKSTASARESEGAEQMNGTMDDAGMSIASEDEEGGVGEVQEAELGSVDALKTGPEPVLRRSSSRVSPIADSYADDAGFTGEDRDDMDVDKAEAEESRPRRRSAEVRIPSARMTAADSSSKKRKFQDDESRASKTRNGNGASNKDESQDSLDWTIVVADSKKRKFTTKRAAPLVEEKGTPKGKLSKVDMSEEKTPKDKTPKDKTPKGKHPPNKTPSSKASSLSKAEKGDRVSARSYDGSTPLRVVFSGDSKVEEMKTTKKFLLKNGIEFVNNVSEDGCDMLCIGTGAPIKTAKLLLAVLLGKQIITSRWTSESAKANCILKPDKYLPANAPPDWHWGSDVGAALARDRRSLFEGKTIFFTRAVKKEYGDGFKAFRDIILKAGAEDVVSKPASEVRDGYVVIALEHGDRDAVSVSEAGIQCYQRDLLSMSILRGDCDLESEEFRFTPMGSQQQAKKGRKRKSA
ncbi:hypothetical protein K490DRAFT_57088 [Saccharata proteae CBS 121410]|uniref:BRCT domain-containing protein n=1 Tax=Saccharata proteae CBS 121410 TaxID=1314787 RepID=A0A9P4HWU9_9PEZI|nr:hypothetical protein K490DRAFT_57088 [Saccharata proteae CBS 121410]